MSRELLIIFVYDPRFCTNESDDPNNSILYFHPPWVSPSQKLALCGQLMGIAKFTSLAFSPPSILTLKSGKFAFKQFGSLTLCVGTDRNIQDSILKKRADTLYSILCTFHYEVPEISDQKLLKDNLNIAISSYLSLLVVSSNIFGATSVLKIPKSGGNILLESMQVLESMQSKSNVLGGMILHHNKIVITQLDFELTKLIQLTDPFRNKIPACNVDGSFHLPMGTQLLYIFVDKSQVWQLRKTANQLQQSLKKVPKWRQKNKILSSTQETKVEMCQDKNMFTVEEELTPDSNTESISSIPDIIKTYVKRPEQKIYETNSKCSSDDSKDELPSFTKFVTLRNDVTRYQSLRNLPKEINDDDSKHDYKYRTLCDPLFPLLRADDFAVSKSLYDKRLAQHYIDLDLKAKDETDEIPQNKKASRPTSIPLNFQSFERKDTLKDDIMTPLMAKLSMTDVFPYATPTDNITTPSTSFQHLINSTSNQQKMILFVVGFQNTSLMVLLEKEAENDPDLIHLLWNLSINSMGDLERSLNNIMSSIPDTYNLQRPDENYGFMVMDTKEAGLIDKHGSWITSQTQLATTIHESFQKDTPIMDVIIRDDDNVVYGNKCGSREIFYQQSGNIVRGLPTPSDLMGVISTTAKRKLQRDHGIVIL